MGKSASTLSGVEGWFSSQKRRTIAAGITAVVLVFLIYSPSLGHGFCPVDDAYFVLENPLVQGGLTWTGIQAAWTSVHASYWAPLLWMSFMVDQAISGGAAWSFHLTNTLLFALSTGLLFALVRRWTGRTGVAFATAMLWALHPARVESVAWVTERKDVLSGLFFLLGLWFYTLGRGQPPRSASAATGKPWNVGVPASPTPIRQRPIPIILAWICMLFGGMAKQVVVVMPLALVLLDVWPLDRTNWGRLWKDFWKLAVEKWAFWLLAIALASIPIWTHVEEQAIMDVPAKYRFAMIPVHYLFYLQKIVWPVSLAPLQDDLPWNRGMIGAGLVLLAGVTAGLWYFRRKAPWALWGWLWFVGLLFPLSGVVWAGSERIAVRFLYLPQIGLILSMVLALAALVRRCGVSRGVARAVMALLLLVCGDLSLRSLWQWRNTDAFSLWIYECHPQQGGACAMGGDTLMAMGDWTKAMEAFEQGVTLDDKACFARLCMVWNQLGHTERTAAAWDKFEKRLGRPLEQFAEWERPQERELLWRVRGQALRAQGDYDGAIQALKEAVRWEADDSAFVLVEYLRACYEGGHPEEGVETAARLSAAAGVRVNAWRDLFPFYAQAWKGGARGYAYVYFADYAERFPEDTVNLNYMAWLLATAPPDGLDHARRDEWAAAAVRWAEFALKNGAEDQVGVWNVVAAARANAGDSTGAVAAAEQALKLAREKNEDDVAAETENRIATYRLGLAWRE